MNDNDLRLIVYSTGTTVDTEITAFVNAHTGLQFETIYPGGLYSTCSFFVPGDPTLPHPAFSNTTKRVEVVNGLKVIWEGQLDIVSPVVQSGGDGWNFECTGYWGAFMSRSRWNKVWCDTRLTQDKWVWQITGYEEQFRLDRYNRLRFMPGNEAFGTVDFAAVRYTCPTGQTINHVTGNYDLQEGLQNWNLSAYDVTNGTAFGSVLTSGTAAFDYTPGAGCVIADLRMYSGASQTGDIDNNYYGEFTNVKVYTEAGTISATEVFKDIAGHFTGINDDTSNIGSNDMAHEPCFMEWNAASDFMSKITAFGDRNNNTWSVGVLASSVARVPDGKPVVYFEQQPALTGYDYVVRLEDIEGQVSFDLAMDEIWNSIIVEYTDSNGDKVIKSGLEDATLQDNTSGNTYGWRYRPLSLGSAGETEALNYARRYLAWFKDPKWRLSSPITVRGTIRTQGQNYVPVCWVRAGQRLMIENYMQEWNGAGITFLITGTSYDEDSQTLSITAGTPDPLATLVARMKR